jgi:hypothetical protein
VAVAVLLATSPTLAGGGGAGSSTFSVDAGDALTGEIVSRPVAIDHSGVGLAGWSLGVCHESDLLELISVADGPALLTAKNGAPPDFHLLQLHPGGFTSGVVVCFTGCALLPPGTGEIIHEPSYQVLGLAPVTATLELCGTLGSPPVPVVVVLPNGSTVPPATVDGGVDIVGPLPLRFRIEVGVVPTLYDPGDGVASAVLPVRIVEDPASAGVPNPISGFTIPLGHNPIFATAVAALPGADLALAGGGSGPDGFFVDLAPGGVVVAATIPLAPPWTAAAPREAALVLYESVANTLAFNFFGLGLPVAVSPAVTVPPTDIEILSPSSLPVAITVQPGAIQFTPREGFRRGDANDDGAVDIADPIALLGYLFSGGALTCREAADANDDGAVDIGDGVALLGFIFAGGDAPPLPYPNCGFDAGQELGCSFHSSCP